MQKLRADMNMGQNIRAMRLARGIKQAEVVRRMQLMGCDLCPLAAAACAGTPAPH